ncbi:MAG: plastocyanin/azurin family copper-binding protein [Solirubrobacteraceae bacterium]
MSKLDGLSPEQRAVLSLVLDARKSYGEAAQILGLSESTVRERAHAAIDALARDPVREPPSPAPVETSTPKRSGTSVKGGLLIGLVLGSIAAAIILLTSGGGKSSTNSTSTPAFARSIPTAVRTLGRKLTAPRSRTSISASTPKSTASIKSLPVSPRKKTVARAAQPTTAAKTTSTPTTTKASSIPSVLSLAANAGGQLQYSTKSLTATAGSVSIDFTNRSPLAHNVTVANSAGEVIGSTPTFQGGTKTLNLALKPGTYKFYCSVPGHRMAGMEGTLTVR